MSAYYVYAGKTSTGVSLNHGDCMYVSSSGGVASSTAINSGGHLSVSSGLSWLAWGCKVPVVMISGFINPTNEFYTPYRIINFHTYNSCWNDMRVDFDHFDYLWRPRHKNTPRQLECTRLITSEQVINTIKTIPAFQKHMEGQK